MSSDEDLLQSVKIVLIEKHNLEKENAELKEALNNHSETASVTQLMELIQVRQENEKLKAREKALGERVLQLQTDKGKLIDENRELKAQNEKLRCCGNCKKYDGGCCKFVNCKYQYVEENREIYNEDHWELTE